jgi:hypothetical protein
VTLQTGPVRISVNRVELQLKGEMMDAEKIRKDFGYEGKPKQWQMGFDALLRHMPDYLKGGANNPRFISIEGGGDWADASVEYLVLLDNYDSAILYQEYCKAGRYQGTKLFFREWLIEKGYARKAEENKDFQLTTEA